MSAPHMNTIGEGSLRRLMARESYDGKMEIERVSQPDDTPFKYTVVDTMMRIDLPEPSHLAKALSSTLIGTTESTMQRPSGHARAMNILKMMATRSMNWRSFTHGWPPLRMFTAGITVST